LIGLALMSESGDIKVVDDREVPSCPSGGPKRGAWRTIDIRYETAVGFARLVVKHSLSVDL